ncbi:MAG: nucleotidyltransferase domain-containing protein [Planctomycetes bacterium]|nr:nucleotidyltransferase domain-containing protein [Planctomycetota bacterium]
MPPEPAYADPVLAAAQPPLLRRIRETSCEVQAIWLFGSLARGQTNANSDLDLAVPEAQPLASVALFVLGLTLGVLALHAMVYKTARMRPCCAVATPVPLAEQAACGGRQGGRAVTAR